MQFLSRISFHARSRVGTEMVSCRAHFFSAAVEPLEMHGRTDVLSLHEIKRFPWSLLRTEQLNQKNSFLHRHTAMKFPSFRCLSTFAQSESSPNIQQNASGEPILENPPRVKFKRPDKTARHIMNILDKEAVEVVRAERDIADIQPGCIVQLKVEVPENKRRISTVKGIVIARRNAGINTTFRVRRLVAGVGIENVYPLYSPNIKEMKVLDRKKVRRAKLYYLRDRMNPLKNK